MRRNEIIADFFGRLNYMDRRGSGIGRILDEYVDSNIAPQFLSDSSFFKVILPNRSVEENRQISVKDNGLLSVGHYAGSNDYGKESSTDWELAYFKDLVMPQFKNDFREKRYDNIIELFDRYRFNYHFNRRIISEHFGVTENTASILINKCIKLGIMEKVKRDDYRFIIK